MRPTVFLAVMLALPLLGGAEEFWLEIDGNDVTFINNGAEFNCGSVIETDLEILCGTLRLYELEEVVDPQYCICPFDLIVRFTLGAGEYTLQVWRLEHWQEEPVMVWVTDFEIVGPGFLTPPRIEQSQCGGWTSAVEEPEVRRPLSWTTLRSLY